MADGGGDRDECRQRVVERPGDLGGHPLLDLEPAARESLRQRSDFVGAHRTLTAAAVAISGDDIWTPVGKIALTGTPTVTDTTGLAAGDTVVLLGGQDDATGTIKPGKYEIESVTNGTVLVLAVLFNAIVVRRR